MCSGIESSPGEQKNKQQHKPPAGQPLAALLRGNPAKFYRKKSHLSVKFDKLEASCTI
jgi:hypothetical protein